MTKTLAHRASALALCTAALSGPALPAHADDGAGAFRIGLGADAFDWHSQDWFRPGGTNSHREGFDLALVAPQFAFQLAGQVTPEIAIGALAVISWGTQTETALATDTGVSGLVQAMAEYAPWAGTLARPFVRVALGIGGSDRSAADMSHYSVLLFEGSGIVGVHLFAAPSFSLSPYARVDYATGPGKETASPTSIGHDLSTSFVAISVGLELIGWIGGASAVITAPPEPIEDVSSPEAPTLDDGVLRTRVTLFGGTRGGALYADTRDPSTVRLRFSTRRAELEQCRTIDVVDGATRTPVPISVERRETGARPHFVVRLSLRASTVALLASRRASLEACTRRFDFSFDSSRTVLAFLASLLEIRTSEPVIPPAPIDSAAPSPDPTEAEALSAPTSP